MTTLPPLRSIQVFEAVANCGTITAAAQILEVSPGAVSQQIRVLETALGVALFERRGRSLRLTAIGKSYYEGIHIGFDQLRHAQDVLQKSRARSGLTMSALPSISVKWLRPLLASWQSAHPDSTILLVGTDDESMLNKGSADFRITYGSLVQQFEFFTQLFVDTVVPVCSPAYLKRNPVRHPRDILAGRLIDIEWGSPQIQPVSWSDWAGFMGFETAPARTTSYTLSCSAIDAAADGEGFALGQLSMISGDVARGQLVVPFDCGMPMREPYYLAWSRDSLQTLHGNAFRSFLRRAGARQAKAVVCASP